MNQGRSSARNTGVNNSKGDYIAFLDSDDLWLDRKLEKQTDLLLNNDIAVVYGKSNVIYEDESKKEVLAYGGKLYSGMVFKELVCNNFIVFSSAIVDRRKFIECGGFPDSYQHSTDYHIFLRLAYKYKVKAIIENYEDWLIFLKDQLYKAILKKVDNIRNVDLIKSEIEDISNFTKLKLHGLLNPSIEKGPVEAYFDYDVISWIDNYDEKKHLTDYKFKKSIKFAFEYSNDQISVRDDVFRRYGTGINSLSKIVTRINNLESQFRKVRYDSDPYLRDVYKKTGDNFTKYTLAH